MSNQFLASFVIEPVWQKVVPWFAEVFLNLPEPITIFTNGSGDTTYNYVSLLVYVIVAGIATIVWSVLDRKRDNYNYALQWLTVLIRYYLIYQMVLYGMAKLFYLQFQPPRFTRLVQAYGDSSPMGILWTFMGQSKGYTMFTGTGELVGGLLLMSRRTTTIGALVVFGVMANVMALNYFYDVPVKILSTHMVLMALFLIALDRKRLINMFFANRSTEPVVYLPYFTNPKTDQIINIIKWVVLIGGLVYFTIESVESMKQYGPKAEKPKLYGLYEVLTFERNGDIIPPLLTDDTRWRRLMVDWKDFATIQTSDDQRQFYTFKPDSLENFVHLKPRGNDEPMDSLYFSEPDSTRFLLEGVFKGDTLRVMFLKKKKEDFLLRNRGFRWVNEYPFNR